MRFKIHLCQIVVSIVAISGLLTACTPASWEEQDAFGENVETDMAIYFKTDATLDQINEFLLTVVGIPVPEQGPTANKLLPELSGLSSITSVDGHTAYGVDFWPDVPQKRRDDVRQRILASPIVYTVLENVAPAEVTALPTAQP